MLKRGAEDPAFATILPESTTILGFIMHKGFDANGDKRMHVVVVSAIDVCICRDFRV